MRSGQDPVDPQWRGGAAEANVVLKLGPQESQQEPGFEGGLGLRVPIR